MLHLNTTTEITTLPVEALIFWTAIEYSLYATNIPKGFGPKIDLIDWPKGTAPDPGLAEGEAALDFQVSIPIIYPQSTKVYQAHDNYDGSAHLGFLDQWLDGIDGSFCTYEGGDDAKVDGTTPNEMCGTFTPAKVISVSYGLAESYWPTSYLQVRPPKIGDLLA